MIGVHEDGAHVLLTDAEGNRYRLPLDEALRVAARRDRPRLGQLQIEIEGAARPREVQALIRSGLSAEEVAQRCGWTVEKVHKYQGPILAEREYVARLAQGVRVRSRSGSYPYGGSAPTLAERAGQRLTTRGVRTEDVAWDAWRRDSGEWTVLASFTAGGRQRQATWSFDLQTRTLTAQDDEARWLGEEEPVDPIAAAPVREVPVYDVEADGGLHAPAGRHRRPAEPVDLMVAMRERSGARARRSPTRRRLEAPLPLDPDGPMEQDAPVEIREPDPVQAPDVAQSSEPPRTLKPAAVEPTLPLPAELPAIRPAEAPSEERSGSSASAPEPAKHQDPPPPAQPAPAPPAVTAPTRNARRRADRATGLAALFRSPSESTEPTGDPPEQTETGPDPAGRRRAGRTPVPSWDDIVLGTRTRDQAEDD